MNYKYGNYNGGLIHLNLGLVFLGLNPGSATYWLSDHGHDTLLSCVPTATRAA